MQWNADDADWADLSGFIHLGVPPSYARGRAIRYKSSCLRAFHCHPSRDYVQGLVRIFKTRKLHFLVKLYCRPH